jgi:hypothetical protein
MDLCDFQIRIDRRVHGDDGGVTAEQVDEGAQVGKHGLTAKFAKKAKLAKKAVMPR